MSFKRESDDISTINLVKKRRVEELLSQDIPEDEANLTKNGRFACLVCPRCPVLDTIEMLCVHRGGKRHKSLEERFLEKREFHQLVEKKRQDAHLHGNNDNETIAEAPLLVQTRKASHNALLRYAPYNPISSGAQSGQNATQDFKTKRSSKKGFFEYTQNFLTNNVPLREPTAGSSDIGQSSSIKAHCSPNLASHITEDAQVSAVHDTELVSETPLVLKPYVSKRRRCTNDQNSPETNHIAEASRKRKYEDETGLKNDDLPSSPIQNVTSHRKVEEEYHPNETDFNDGKIHSWERHHQQLISEYPPMDSETRTCEETNDKAKDERIDIPQGRGRRVKADARNKPQRDVRTGICDNVLSVAMGNSNSKHDFERLHKKQEYKCDKSEMDETTMDAQICNLMEERLHGQKRETKVDMSKNQVKFQIDKIGANEVETPLFESSSHQLDGSSKDGQNKSIGKLNRSGPSVKFAFMNIHATTSSLRQKLPKGITTDGTKVDNIVTKNNDAAKKKAKAAVVSSRTSKYSEERKRELERHLDLTSSGWIHDPSGKWIRDENVEFDSDEEEEEESISE
ncbi:putative sodium channel modifier 1-like [Apostichopus japonicus]|uniref:Sodium channel modifier 1 n=1 Tax=Stichopus japonicus TaxID=307972 RepID=A0A2G8K1G0_STIJA|nr:putative sodium channel modifier 1-like [Apostichopus japonicus]